MNSIENYRAQVGIFNFNKSIKIASKNKFSQLFTAFLKFLSDVIFIIGLIFSLARILISNSTNTILKSRISIYVFLLFQSNKQARPHNNIFLGILRNLLIFLIIIFSAMKLTKIALRIILKALSKFDNNKLCIILTFYYFKCSSLLFLCGDIKLNPGPPSCDHFKFMHWNSNSIPAHNFARVPLIQTYNAIHNFHIIAISETALKNEIHDDKIDIPGYTLVRSDLPKDDTHGGVMIYHKMDLAVKNRIDITNHSNIIVLELSISRKKIVCSGL